MHRLSGWNTCVQIKVEMQIVLIIQCYAGVDKTNKICLTNNGCCLPQMGVTALYSILDFQKNMSNVCYNDVDLLCSFVF